MIGTAIIPAPYSSAALRKVMLLPSQALGIWSRQFELGVTCFIRFSTCLICSAGGRYSGSVPPMRLIASRTSWPTCLWVSNGLLLIMDLLAGQLVARLGHAELVGGKLGGIHAVQ